MDILHFTTEKENSFCFNFLEEKIREASREMIEKIYAEEVQAFLDKTALIVDEKGNRLVVRNGWSKERTIQTASGNITVKLPRVDLLNSASRQKKAGGD